MIRRAALIGLALTLAGCQGWLRWEDGGSRPIDGGGLPPASREETDPPPGDDYYRVRGGDTLYSIAFRHNVDFRDLARWNGVGESYLIVPGQVLRLTPPAAAAPPPTVARPAPSRPPAASPSTPTRTADAGDPVWQWPLRGAIVERFKPPDSKGVDIAGAEGAPVSAAAAGEVVYSGTALRGYGELIIIKHNETWLTAYGYNKRRLVKQGERVKAGQQIGEVGLGPGQRSLLHFEVRRRGKPVNPLDVLKLD